MERNQDDFLKSGRAQVHAFLDPRLHLHHLLDFRLLRLVGEEAPENRPELPYVYPIILRAGTDLSLFSQFYTKVNFIFIPTSP